MSPRYMEALSEVEYIIKSLENEDIEKIPKKFRDFISDNKSRTYKISSIENLREDTYAILAFIYRKFLSPIEEREDLEREYNEKLRHEKELMSEKTANLKMNHSTKIIGVDTVEASVKENVALIEYVEDKWYKKVFGKIKKLLGKN